MLEKEMTYQNTMNCRKLLLYLQPSKEAKKTLICTQKFDFQ